MMSESTYMHKTRQGTNDGPFVLYVYNKLDYLICTDCFISQSKVMRTKNGNSLTGII